ncbi:MAG TPA: PP2C family serine/threonine-protein phosphatase [Burkholderiales bacterium]|nr:PP2C family serine/threonine-protein phosphatase [Burkholderiales bacterium]
MKFSIAEESHVGRRPSNQDRLGHWRTEAALLLVVADGMGGHANGDYAAELAVRYAAALFRREATPRLADPAGFLRAACLGAHVALLQEEQALGLADTPRTTVVAGVVQDGWVHWAHVGDSRLYLLRGGEVQARTVDHTLAQELVDAGWLPAAEIRGHPDRNRLLQCLGGLDTPRVDAVGLARLETNDVLLLCTDGLWEPVLDRQLAAGLDKRPLGPALAGLARLARERAGAECDNVSALALTWDEPTADARGVDPGPRLVPIEDAEAPATPDPDILRAMLADPDSDLARMRRTLPDPQEAP